MKRLLSLVAFLPVLGMMAAFGGFSKVQAPESKSDAHKLLDESFGLLDQIDHSSRVFYLLPLTQAGARIRHPREEEWCKQLFHEALQVRDPWDRVALEKNAVVALSAVNGNAAMELFWRVEEPVPDARGGYPEDVRADAATSVFPNFLDAQMEGVGKDESAENRLQTALGEIQRHAVQIAKTGEYPYRAMDNVIKKLIARKNHESAINLIFSEGVKFYSEGKPKFRNRDAEFLVLLQTAINAVSDPGLVHTAINQFVKNMRSSTLQTDVSFEAEYRTADGTTIKFADRNKALLFRALPFIRKADPNLAKSITDESAQFNKASEDMTYISAGVVEGTFNAQETAAMHAKMRQVFLLGVIQGKQQKDPLQARQFANELTDSGLRLVGLSNTLPGLMRVDPVAARTLYADQRTQLQEVAKDDQRLQATVALAKAASAVKDEDDFNSLATRAFEQAAEMYQEDYRQRPDLRPDLHKGYSELRDLVRFATAHNLNWTIDRIRSIQNVELRAHLLVFAAEGIAEQNRKVQ